MLATLEYIPGYDRSIAINSPLGVVWPASALSPNLDEVEVVSLKTRQPPETRGTVYVVKALEAALWALGHTDDFETGALAAVNPGDDADTTGAIYGQLAGAFYGIDAIPESWQGRLAMSGRILEMADELLGLSGRI